MQTNCPQCSNRLVLDDAKIPATPFMLKCPKCKGTVKLPGRGGAGASSGSAPKPSPSPSPPSPAPVASPSPSPPSPPAMPPPAVSTPVEAGPSGRALVVFATAEQTAAVAAVLGRAGFAVEQLEQGTEQVIRLQQGEYDLVATSRNGLPDDKNIYRMVQVLPPDVRRRLFLLLVGDEFHSGEGTQAFATVSDLVVHPKDIASSDRLLTHTLSERRRLFQTYWDAEDRKTEGKL